MGQNGFKVTGQTESMDEEDKWALLITILKGSDKCQGLNNEKLFQWSE